MNYWKKAQVCSDCRASSLAYLVLTLQLRVQVPDIDKFTLQNNVWLIFIWGVLEVEKWLSIKHQLTFNLDTSATTCLLQCKHIRFQKAAKSYYFFKKTCYSDQKVKHFSKKNSCCAIQNEEEGGKNEEWNTYNVSIYKLSI